MPLVSTNGRITLPWFAWLSKAQQSSYNPAVSAGAMTISALVVTQAQFAVTGNVCFVELDLSFTTSGTAGNIITVSLPIPPSNNSCVPSAVITDGAKVAGLAETLLFGVDVQRYDGANWGLGAARRIKVSGSYFI
jgi:hypothetical protein